MRLFGKTERNIFVSFGLATEGFEELPEVVGVVGHRLPINAGKDVVGCARILNNQAFLQIFSRKQADFVCVDEFVDQNV